MCPPRVDVGATALAPLLYRADVSSLELSAFSLSLPTWVVATVKVVTRCFVVYAPSLFLFEVLEKTPAFCFIVIQKPRGDARSLILNY